MQSAPEDNPEFAAVVLAGGGGRRLGGVDKAGLELAGTTLLERALSAVGDATERVAVGPRRELPADIRQTQEQPPGGGPVAAVAAGLDALRAGSAATGTGPTDLVVVLACDMPFVSPAAVAQLVRTCVEHPDADGVAFVDEQGRRQHLAAAYRTTALRDALAGLDTVRDAAMRDLAKLLTVVEIAADPETTLDCDTWADVHRSRAFLEER